LKNVRTLKNAVSKTTYDMIKGGMDMDMSQGMNQKQMMKFAKKFMKGKKMRF